VTRLFSERKGLKPVKSVVQIDSMDDELRAGLWNALCIFYFDNVKLEFGNSYLTSDRGIGTLCRRLWLDYFKRPLDSLPREWSTAYDFLRDEFLKWQWNEVYDFIEFVASAYPETYAHKNPTFMDYCNRILEREVSAYRFVAAQITQLTSEEEIAEIEEALDAGDPMRPVALHLQRALELLSDRKSPDYRNSVKESISAVESACKLLTASKKGDLDAALKQIKQQIGLHPALEQAFAKMYGYAGDAQGIRHALMDEPNLDFEDAKFMLVACSAFVNYLRAKAVKAKIQ